MEDWKKQRLEEAERKKLLQTPEYRQDLRKRVLGTSLIQNLNLHTIETTFDGYGDTGQCYDALLEHTTECEETKELYAEVNDFLRTMVDIHADWDWYNNDGGGGSIEWSLVDNVITIEGHYNETVERPVPGLEF